MPRTLDMIAAVRLLSAAQAHGYFLRCAEGRMRLFGPGGIEITEAPGADADEA